jgi:hypothetical protein
MRKWLMGAVVTASAVGSVVSTQVIASASPPVHGSFSSHQIFVDSDVCAPEGFAVYVVQDETNDGGTRMGSSVIKRSRRGDRS